MPPARSRRGGVAFVWVVIALASAADRVGAQELFLDPQFTVRRTNAVVYGTAGVLSPSPGNFDLLLDLYEPEGPGAPAARPGYILIHGGGFTGGNRSSMAQHANELAARGYVCISISYRLDGQQPVVGSEFQPFFQAVVLGLGGTPLSDGIAAAVEDATTAHRWFVANAAALKLDTSRIAMGGSSAGAITSLMVAYSLDDHQVTNLPAIRVVMDLWGALYGLVGDLETGEPPLIGIHGEDDTVVPFVYAEQLAARAVGQGVTIEYHPIAGRGHGVPIFTTEVSPGVTLFDRVVQFSYEHLGLATLGRSEVEPPHWARYR